MENHTCCHSAKPKERVGYRLKVTIGIFCAILAFSFLPFSFLGDLNTNLVSYINLVWWAVILGILIGGLVDYFVPSTFINRLLGGGNFRSIIYAVVSGFLLSACSHGILAIAIQLYKKGASTAAVVTFLLASPWANLPVTLLLFSFFGWQALLFIGAAMVIAVITGVTFLFLEQNGLVEASLNFEEVSKDNWQKVAMKKRI